MKIKRPLGGLVSLCLVAALAVILAPTNSQAATAPQAGGKEMGMPGGLQAAGESLNLTDDPKARVKDIFADAKTKTQGGSRDASLSVEQTKNEMKGLHPRIMAHLHEG